MEERNVSFFLAMASLLFCLLSCGLTETRPKLEMSMAASAFLAAQESKANVLAPGLYRKAEVYYMKAKSAYRRKYFVKAKQFAQLSQKFAEQAEFVAVKKVTLEGDGSQSGPSEEPAPAPPPPPAPAPDAAPAEEAPAAPSEE